MSDDEKLTLRMAVELLGIDADTSRPTANTVCPVCAKHPWEKKLNLNFDKGDDGGVFHCAKCDIGGRPLHLWALYRNLSTDDMKAVSRDYHQYRNQNQARVKKAATVKPVCRIEETPMADIDTRNKTYRALLSILTLSPEHKKNLLDRGLPEDVIARNGYKSYPTTGHTDIAELLLSRGYVLKGVPGFFTRNGRWTMLWLPSGYLIPQRDGYGRIQGLQIRVDKANENGNRYFTISTGDKFQNGTKGATFCHLAQGEKGLTEIILTEGPLKGDIITEFTGYTTLAIPGVKSLTYMYRALYDLKKAGCRCVTIALDMDKFNNEHVMKAQDKIAGIIGSLDLNYKILEWDYNGKEYKGLDDWLLAKRKGEF